MQTRNFDDYARERAVKKSVHPRQAGGDVGSVQAEGRDARLGSSVPDAMHCACPAEIERSTLQGIDAGVERQTNLC